MTTTPDTLNSTSNLGLGLPYVVNPSASSDGGSWVGMFRYDNSDSYESFGQSVNGFEIGKNYSLSWLHGNFGFGFYTEANAIEVLLDGIAIGSGSSLGLGSQWLEESISFLATQATHQIAFRLKEAVSSYHSIDGIKLSINDVVNVNEPSLFGLFGLAAGMMAYRRKSKV